MSVLNVYIGDEQKLEEKLKDKAEKNDRSVSYIVKDALKQYFKKDQ